MLKGANQRSHSSVTKKRKKWGREDIENPTLAIDTPIPKIYNTETSTWEPNRNHFIDNNTENLLAKKATFEKPNLSICK